MEGLKGNLRCHFCHPRCLVSAKRYENRHLIPHQCPPRDVSLWRKSTATLDNCVCVGGRGTDRESICHTACYGNGKPGIHLERKPPFPGVHEQCSLEIETLCSSHQIPGEEDFHPGIREKSTSVGPPSTFSLCLQPHLGCTIPQFMPSCQIHPTAKCLKKTGQIQNHPALQIYL